MLCHVFVVEDEAGTSRSSENQHRNHEPDDEL